MGSKTRLSSYCTKRANNGVNLVTSREINTRLARPIHNKLTYQCNQLQGEVLGRQKIWDSVIVQIKLDSTHRPPPPPPKSSPQKQCGNDFSGYKY